MEAARVVLADPPWRHDDALGARGAAANYRTLSVLEICQYPVPPVANDALLFLWRLSSMQEAAITVARTWGFVPHSEIVWVKTSSAFDYHPDPGRVPSATLAFGMGRIVRGSHETCLVCKRGRPEIRDRSVRTVFFAPRQEHSRKPDRMYELVERLSEGPYVELFARRRRHGWLQFGDELEPTQRTVTP